MGAPVMGDDGAEAVRDVVRAAVVLRRARQKAGNYPSQLIAELDSLDAALDVLALSACGCGFEPNI